MIEQNVNLWDCPAKYRCVTTNGVVKSNGELVMGAGIALQAKQRYPKLPAILGKNVSIFGNKPFFIEEYKIISFPTKHNWKDSSNIRLIEKSAREILAFVNVHNVKSVALTRPGCGLGNLSWVDVKVVLEKYFDNRFIICY